jgi:hypothetical protein
MQQKLCTALIAMLCLSNCALVQNSGDAGCISYGEARVSMPTDPEILPTGWLSWVVSTDTRMTATCR